MGMAKQLFKDKQLEKPAIEIGKEQKLQKYWKKTDSCRKGGGQWDGVTR